MFEKEAEDFLKKSLKVDDDEFDFFKNEASCKEEIKRLTDFIEPREKRIAELEKENAELKEKISVLLSCKKCPENKGGWICVKEYEDKCLAQKITFIKELKKENAEMKEQLTKAMKKKVIYISGKITGTSDYADRFSAVENKLIAEGYEVMNPVREGKWLEHYLEPKNRLGFNI